MSNRCAAHNARMPRANSPENVCNHARAPEIIHTRCCRSVVQSFPNCDETDVTRLTGSWKEVTGRMGGLTLALDQLQLGFDARSAAQELMLEDTRDLARWLRARRLPPYMLLRNWYYVALLSERFSTDRSLSSFALHRNQYPSVYYRFVDRVCGRSWSEVRYLGPRWVQATALGQWAPWISRM